MNDRRRHAQKGSLVLVVLCFLAVLGIGLAGFLAVSNQSMRLSNRSYVSGVSKQVSEIGLEQALRAFNSNDWSGWTITGTTATRTVNFPSTKYGTVGLTAAVNLRVDNYNAYNQAATWSSSTSYSLNDLVGYNGTWYRSVQNANLNKNPSIQTDLSWWVPDPIPWAWSSYTAYTANSSVVCYGGTWYRCITTHTSTGAFAPANWTSMPAPSLAWNNATTYSLGAFVYSSGTWYRCTNGAGSLNSLPPSGDWSTASPYISWGWRNSVAYNFNDVVYYRSAGPRDNWYRCITPTTAGDLPTGAKWENALSTSWAWSGSHAYNLNDVIYRNGSFYRCILAHTNQGPPNTTYWSTDPVQPTAWDSGKQYPVSSVVRYNGSWYRCRSSNTGQVPPIISPYSDSYWYGTADTTRQWAPNTAYSAGTHRSYGGVWYVCTAATTVQSPNDANYWTAMTAPVVYAQGTVTYPGGAVTATQLRATVAPAPLFPNAAGAVTTLNVSGGGTVDSYDSTRSPYAAQVGLATNYSAVLAAGYTAGTAITLSSTAVSGYLAAPAASTAPYFPLFSSGGSVKGFTSPASPSIDLTRVSRSPYIPQFDTLPAGGLTAAFVAGNFAKGTPLNLATTTTIGSPGACTPSRYYYNGDLAIGLGSALTTLNINGPVILYINGDLVMDGSPNGLININSTGSAEIHIADSLTINIASDGINNTTLDPKKLILICDAATSSTQNYSDGTHAFYGVLYMPNTTNASGLVIDNGSVQVYGALSARKITYSGANANLHYDTSLRYATFGGIDAPYTIAEWRELTDSAEKITLP